MTNQLDTAAIKAQLRIEADQGYQRPGATTAMHATILALCDALDDLAKRDRELRMKVERMVTQITEASNQARYRRTEIKGHQRRIGYLQAENERLRAAMQRIVSCYQENGWLGKEYNIARAALSHKEG